MQKQKRTLSLLFAVALAICFTSLVVTPAVARIPPETFYQTYTQYGDCEGFKNCYAKGTLIVTYYFPLRGGCYISYSYSASGYDGSDVAHSLEASMYRDGDGETLEVIGTFSYGWFTSGMFAATAIHVLIHYSESTGQFTCWGYCVDYTWS